MNTQTKFDQRVAVEAILYLASKSQEPTFHHIFKLLYWADRFHLARYGRLIYGDRYIAMKDGPVPSATVDILKSLRQESLYQPSADITQSLDVRNNQRIVARREPNLEWLSDSDIECLDESLRLYDCMTYGQLTELCHDDAWQSADRNNAISFTALVQSVDRAEELHGLLIEHLNDPVP